MAEEWHYSRDGQQLGPVSGDELRRMASAGELQPTDQIWKEGMPKWATANKLKGLTFPAAVKKSTAGPPPLEPPSEKPPTLSETLKAAGSLAANQAKKAQLNTVSLPAAFLRLGKNVFEKRIGQEEFGTEFHELDELAVQIKAFDEAGKGTGHTAKGFGENAKALAQNATDAAKKKMATVRFDQALTRLGKGVFEQRGNLDLPQQLIDRITDHHQQIESLDELIQTTTVPNPGWSVFENRFVHSVLGVVFFPVGLFLIWRSELWTKQAKLIWTGAIAFFVAVAMLSPKPERSQSTGAGARGVYSTTTSGKENSLSKDSGGNRYKSNYDEHKRVGVLHAQGLNHTLEAAKRLPPSRQETFVRDAIFKTVKHYAEIAKQAKNLEMDSPGSEAAERIKGLRDGWLDGFNSESKYYQQEQL